MRQCRLSCYHVNNGNYVGSISVGQQRAPNDISRPLGSFIVPIPKSIEVRAEGGTPV